MNTRSPDPSDGNLARCAAFERLSLADPRAAVEAGSALLAQLLAEGDLANYGFAARTQVNALGHLGRLGEAIALAAAARRRIRAHAPVEAARLLIAAMHPRAKAGNLRGSLRAGERAVREFTALGEDDLVARAELNLANVAKAAGRADHSIELIRRVLARGERIASIRGQALNVLGEALVQTADFAGARAAFEDARAVCRAQGFAVGNAVITGNLADTAARAGDIEGALRLFSEARELHAALGASAEVCRNALEEATLLEFAGLTADALDLAGSARTIADEHRLAAESARARLVSGRVLAARGAWRLAHLELDDAAARFCALGDHAGSAQALTARARCEEGLQGADPERTAREAVRAAESSASPIERALAFAALARTAKDDTDAAHAAMAADRLAAAAGIPALNAESLAASACAALRARRVGEAVAHARRAFDEVARSRENLALARTRRAFLTRRSDIAHALVGALLADGSPDACAEAFDTLERARSLAIQDALLRGEARGEARDPATGASLRELTRAIDPVRPDLGAIRAADRADRAHERELLERGLLERGLRPDPTPARAADELVRAIACPAIAFVEIGGAVHALARYPDGTTRATVVTSDRSGLAQRVDAYHFQVQRRLATRTGATEHPRMRAAAVEAERALAEAILSPTGELVDMDSDACTIVAMPSALLAGVPLATIARGGARIAVAPSLAIAAMLDRPTAGGPDAPLVVSVSDAHAPAITREGEMVSGLIGPDRVHLDGADATIAAVHQALGRATRAHLACHGIFPADAPNLAGLRLSDGWYTARDAHALERAPTDLVLSGCSTGSTATRDGEEWSGLVRGFAAAGTRRIVASLWQVDDSAALELMEAAYRNPSGVTRGILCAARALCERGSHPAISSAFAIFGGATAFESKPRVCSVGGPS